MLSGIYLYKYKYLIIKLKYFLALLFVSIVLFTLNFPFYPLFGGMALLVIALQFR